MPIEAVFHDREGVTIIGLQRHELQLALCEVCAALREISWLPVSERNLAGNPGHTVLHTDSEVLARIQFERDEQYIYRSAHIRTDLLARYHAEIFQKYLPQIKLTFEPLRPYLNRQ